MTVNNELTIQKRDLEEKVITIKKAYFEKHAELQEAQRIIKCKEKQIELISGIKPPHADNGKGGKN